MGAPVMTVPGCTHRLAATIAAVSGLPCPTCGSRAMLGTIAALAAFDADDARGSHEALATQAPAYSGSDNDAAREGVPSSDGERSTTGREGRGPAEEGNKIASPGSGAISVWDLRDIRNDARAEGRHDDAAQISAEIFSVDTAGVVGLLDALGDPAELLAALDRAACTESLAEFVIAAWHITDPGTPLQWSWHHQLICDVVQGVLEDWLHHRSDPTFVQRARNAVFGLPPGSLKSRILAVMLPAWMWLRCPSWTVLALSINSKAVLRDARACREIVESPWYQQTFKPSWSFKVDQDALSDYGNTAGGTRLSRGITAEVVGLRADLLLIDDPNAPDAQSQSACDDVIEHWETSLWNRVNSLETSCRFIVQQRVHVDDLTGYVLRQPPWSADNARGWLHVCLPVEFDPARACVTPWGSDPRTFEGECLHPARFSPGVIAEERAVRTPYNFEAQMNLRPTVRGGNNFQRSWWKFYVPSGVYVDPDTRPRDCVRSPAIAAPVVYDWKCISIDPSGGSTEATASNVAVVVIGGVGPARYVIEDRTRGPRTYLQQCADVVAAIVAHPDVNLVLIEKKALGAGLIEYLEREILAGNIKGGPYGRSLTPRIEAYEPTGKGSKEERAAAIEPDLYGGMVVLPDGADWLVNWVDEFAIFPQGKDDRIDALAQCIDHYREMGYAEMVARCSN